MSIGLSPDEGDENSVSDDDFAAAMGIDVPEPSTSNATTAEQEAPSRETMWAKLQQQAEQIKSLQQHLETLEQDHTEVKKELADARNRADHAEAVADAAIGHVRNLHKELNSLRNGQQGINKTLWEDRDSHDGTGKIKSFNSRISDLEHDRVDVSDLINSDATHDLEIQRKTAARLAAEREDADSPLSGNKHRMTFLWREFIESAQKTKGGKLELDSSACRRRLEHRAGIHDPNTNTVQRSMKMLARHTRQDGGVSGSDEWDDVDNLVRFEPGERGGQAARLVADADEFREFAAEQSRAALEQGGDE
ncbi:hypothetical protein SAMN05421858_4863 [Haladaptatus litoreus]|uniref:Uncharacterized protein n=1 Tax=Haladaptatus litoreus TaxID=553468 RepID=A0A1N7FA90_9EURY|nr:hypothetical protein [Haladaptatus litoreus]SIR97186.1 hypothetical protein SAMN05421858_4863 [Haladaptatus litoreus]